MKMMRMLTVIACGLFLVLPSWAPAQDAGNYILAVPTHMSTQEMYQSWEPFVKKLSKEVGANISLKLYKTIPEYEADLLKGVPDFALMNIYLQVRTKKSLGYIPLVRDKNPLFGILVVKKDSRINSLQDLKHKELAFPTPNVFAASLYLRALLAEKEKINFTPQYVMSHSNVYRNVALGSAVAGGGVNKTLNKEKDEIKSQLRVLFKTPEFAPHPLSAHPRVSQKLRQDVIDVIMKMAQGSDRELLVKIQMSEPVKADYKKDYSSLESLNLDKYFVAGSE